MQRDTCMKCKKLLVALVCIRGGSPGALCRSGLPGFRLLAG